MKIPISTVWARLLSCLKTPRFYRENAGEIVLAFLLIYSYFLLHRKFDFLPLLLLMAAGIITLFCGRKTEKAAFIGLLGIMVCVERHFILHYNESFREIGAQALITLHITSPEECQTYLSLLKWEEILQPLLFAGGIIAVCVSRGWHLWSRLWCLIALGCFLGTVYYNVSVPVRGYFQEWGKMGEFILQREAFHFDSRDISGEERSLRILVIGESHRQDFCDDYMITPKYAPLLQQAREKGTAIFFSDMLSLYPQTWFAVFTALTRRDGTNQVTYFPEKGLPSLFKEAGYNTYWITYQPQGISMTGYDYLTNECDVYFNHRDESGTRMDMGMIPILERLTASDEKKILIIIKMVGVHFNFHTRYPDQFKIHTPAYDEKNFSGCSFAGLELLRNSYKNGMAYSGTFLDTVAGIVRDRKDSAMMCFISDHGIGLYDDGEQPFFGRIKGNYHIPFFFYGNDAYWQKLPPEKRQNLMLHKNFPLTNRYLFETFASASGVTYPGNRPELDLTDGRVEPAGERKVWVWSEQLDYNSLR